MSSRSPTVTMTSGDSPGIRFKLPPLINSIKEGWQLTGGNGAVVSSLLAGVAAQLLSFFKSTGSYQHAGNGVQRFIVASCYWALIFNIGAAISSFVMIDYLGEIPYHASKLPKGLLHVGGEVPADGANVLLRRYSGHGDSAVWLWISFHWLICLFCGILTLIVAILAYVWAEELLWVKLTTFGAVVFVVIPPFILVAWQRHT